MTDGPTPAGRLAADAEAYARAVADRYGIRVVELVDIADHLTVADLLCRVWQAESPAHVIAADLIRALAHAGNYVAGAYRDDRLLGATIGFFGAGHLHSHVTGVAAEAQGHGVGYALKQHQRGWALRRGITEIRWTFDPLVCRNAHFNLAKLGALPTAYLPDFYGPMQDGLNDGDESDRLYVTWRLDARTPAGTRTPGSAAAVLLDRVDGRPVPSTRAPTGGTGTALVAVPADVEALRRTDPALATRWRRAVRAALTGALDAGLRITGFTADARYLLQRP